MSSHLLKPEHLTSNTSIGNKVITFNINEDEDEVPIINPIGKKDARCLIRKSLLHGGDAAEQIDDDEDSDQTHSCPCAKKLRSTFQNRLRVFNEISATNLKLRPGPEAGYWDTWGIYYCSSRYGRQTDLNASYFSLACLFVISQGNMFNLILYIGEHGGAAFLVVLALVYISLGYPMYLFETMMGQYCGRKPTLMLKLMLPALTGLGPALYLRTMVKATNALSIFIYSSYLALSLFFCKTDNVLIYRFVEAEQRNKLFNFLYRNISRAEGGTLHHDLFHWWWLIIFTIILFIFVAQELKLYGEISNVVVKVLLLGMLGYFLVGISRIAGAKAGSIVFLPLKTTFATDWRCLIKGKAWLDAMIFVIQSMELGTLVHPYLGGKNCFHYRSQRDGLFIVLIAYFWNFITATAALAWLGYVGLNESEIKLSIENLFGHYGLVIVYMLKHLQAEMTQVVQRDVLFFNGCFYAIIGIGALLAFIVYVIIIVDCSYPESGQLLWKLCILVLLVSFFGLIVPGFLLHAEGLRRLIYIDFYANQNWSAFFVVGAYFSAVSFGHELGKFVHDFLNIIHIPGYRSKQHSYHVPRILRIFVLTFTFIGLISAIFIRPFPHEGQTDWTHKTRYLGAAFSCVPLLSVISVGFYYCVVYKKESLKPNRSWYKNKHHVSVCFADFATFKGIPELVDPENQDNEFEQLRIKRQSRKKSRRFSTFPGIFTKE